MRRHTSDSADNIGKLVQEINLVVDVRVLLKIRIRGGGLDIILNVILYFLDLEETKESS